MKTLNEWNVHRVPICLDASIMNVVRKMEQLSIPILNVNNREDIPREPHIYITSNVRNQSSYFYQEVNIDFSLHEDFSDMKEFIKKVNPKKAIIVHCAKEYSPFEETIEQTMMLDGDCRTQFIFAEEKEIYKL